MSGSWPFYFDTVGVSNPDLSDPVLVDMTGDGDLELVASAIVGYPKSEFVVLNSDGSWDVRWTANIYKSKGPVVGDLDGDGDLEIVVGEGTPEGKTGKMYAWHHDGTLVNGWPAPFDSTVFTQGTAVIGDIDGDYAPEVLIGTTRSLLYAFHSNGTLVDGFPLQ